MNNTILTVKDSLLGITHQEIVPFLSSKHDVDPVAGIVIVQLDGIEVLSDQGYKYHFHAARVFTSTFKASNFVTPHYHQYGVEPYNILSGANGEMNLGRVVNGIVEWEKPQIVKAGDFIEVQEKEVHSLRNNGHTPLDFTFACPDNHLVNNSVEYPEGDRYLTNEMPNGIPPHYFATK